MTGRYLILYNILLVLSYVFLTLAALSWRHQANKLIEVSKAKDALIDELEKKVSLQDQLLEERKKMIDLLESTPHSPQS